MKAIEKAKIALRKHLLENKEQVKLDLENMRKLSKGTDIYSYVENLSSSISLSGISITKEKSYDYSFDEVDTYGIIDELKSCYEWYPPDDVGFVNSNKKDSDKISESFFFNKFDLWKKYKKLHFHLKHLRFLNFHITKIMTMDLISS